MNICFFGSYDPNYSRNSILINGLNQNNVKVFQCRSTYGSVFLRYPDLIRKYWKIRNEINVIYVAFVGQLNMPLAWILARLTGKKLVFDMFYSMYDTYVYDRQSAKPNSIQAKLYFSIDKMATILADEVITDTKSSGNYYKKLFNINPNKLHHVYVGAEEIFIKRKHKDKKKLIVEFHGMFTRLTGAKYFIEAAKILENNKKLEFWLIGDSQIYKKPLQLLIKLKPKNLIYFPKMPVRELAKHVSQADVSISHLGTSKKARIVITNKTFHSLACGIAVIVINSSGNRELLEDKKNVVMVRSGNTKDLVEQILILLHNPKLRQNIADNGYRMFQKFLTNKQIAKDLLIKIS